MEAFCVYPKKHIQKTCYFMSGKDLYLENMAFQLVRPSFNKLLINFSFYIIYNKLLYNIYNKLLVLLNFSKWLGKSLNYRRNVLLSLQSVRKDLCTMCNMYHLIKYLCLLPIRKHLAEGYTLFF